MVTLSSITVTWNSEDYIKGCIDSLRQGLSDLDAEIIVVDNNSTDGTVETVRSYPDVNLIRNKENVGFGRANNQGVEVSKGEILLFLNPDTVVHEGAIKRMVSFLKNNKKVGMVGPEQVSGEGKLLFNYSRFSWRGVFEFVLEKLAPKSSFTNRLRNNYRVKHLNAACILVRKKALVEAGLFDEKIFLYGEERDVCSRLREKGWQIYFLRNIFITHFKAKSSEQISIYKRLSNKVRSLLIFLAKRAKTLLGLD